MVTKRIISVFAAVTFALPGCSADSDEPGTNASGEAKEPSVQDADLVDYSPAPGDPSLGQPDPATTFIPLLNWSFESASPDCNGWPVVGAGPSIRAVPAKTGSYSCKICSTGAPEIALTQRVGTIAKGTYTLSAFVRKRVNTAAPSHAVARINGVKVVASAPIDVREEWDRLQATISVDEETSNLSISVGSDDAQPDNCLFVDDIAFTRNL